MGSLLREILQHPDEIYPLVKLKMAVRNTKKTIPQEPHWDFCFSMCFNLSTGFSYILPELDSELRCVMSVFYLVLRALDTIEDDTSIPIDVKVPILKEFYQHINDPEWHFSCGREKYKTLMDQFHHVSTAFMELDKSYQDVIVDITSRMGAGMAKFIDKKIETVDDYDEYCHYAAGLVGLGLSKILHIAGLEDLGADYLCNSMGLFLQKANIIRDYLEDINEKPPRMFWPHQIWSKYVNKLEDLKYKENSTKAVQCLNDMITNALVHVENCFKCMSPLRDPIIFRFCAIPQIVAFGTLAMAYNNIELFRGVVKLRRGLIAKIIDQTNTMDDVYGAFYDFSSVLKSKVDYNDPNAKITLSRLKTIQKICWDSGSLDERKSYPIKNQLSHLSMVIVLIIAVIFAYLSMIRLGN